ncbi:hypothetical protein O6H91_06G092600 [Diphasiastrum complanatum]|uniref:Uncharacterized protein n=1 Tax=Diphasiastrum complanatum TaxID=34168 RepID=A0ACC2DGM5_DIPCM|nr:hypothetical protein O6H91_06G092600 [Diphasiastrum complanatum]
MATKAALAPSTGASFRGRLNNVQTEQNSNPPRAFFGFLTNLKMSSQLGHRGQGLWPSMPNYTSVCRPSWRMNVERSVQQKMVGGRKAGPILVPCTRRLILLRHAKSSWTNRSLRDHERPLSTRGRRAAANIAAKLREKGWIPEIILCSDSIRTRETLGIMQQHFLEYLEAEVHFLGSYYAIAAMDGETTKHLQETVCRFSKDNTTTVMCMGHNRGWEEAASMFSGVPVELKTANAALLEAYGASWDETFQSAGTGGWKLLGIVKPDQNSESSDDIDNLI